MFVIKLKNFLNMSNIGFQNLFSIPIFTTFINKKVSDNIENIFLSKLPQLKLQGNNYTDFFSNNKIFKLNEISFLLKELNIHIINFSKETEIQIGNQIDYWVQDYKTDNFHSYHAHPKSSISGIYYIRANQNSGPVEFINPNPYEYFFNLTQRQKLSHKIYPQKGLLVLFPSYLFHNVIPSNHKDVVRTSFVFNVTLPYSKL